MNGDAIGGAYDENPKGLFGFVLLVWQAKDENVDNIGFFNQVCNKSLLTEVFFLFVYKHFFFVDMGWYV